jgi:TonB family protein
LGHVYDTGTYSGCDFTAVVGVGGYDSDWDRELVVCASDGSVWEESRVVAPKAAVSRKLKIGDIMRKKLACAFLSLCGAAACFAQTPLALCPRHIETPTYPTLARVAHITGKVILAITIDSEGNVTDAKVTNDTKSIGVLEPGSISNIRLWTFAKPPTFPYSQTIVYDYELDVSLPGDDGNHPIVKVNFDLPDRVTIAANVRFIDHGPGSGTIP